ncbi:hypothetical protein CAJAP_04747 [Camponotus japonicus]
MRYMHTNVQSSFYGTYVRTTDTPSGARVQSLLSSSSSPSRTRAPHTRARGLPSQSGDPGGKRSRFYGTRSGTSRARTQVCFRRSLIEARRGRAKISASWHKRAPSGGPGPLAARTRLRTLVLA